MATAADLRNDVLQEMGVLGIGETASAEDAVLVDEILSRVHEWLVVKDLAYWGDGVTLMPEEAQEPFISLVADRSAGRFDLDRLKVQELSVRASQGLSELRQLAANEIAGEPIEATYF